MKKRSFGNPFRIHGLVAGDYFTDRVKELKRLVHALTEPGSKLLVYSPRRMGKTSAVMNAVAAGGKGLTTKEWYLKREVSH